MSRIRLASSSPWPPAVVFSRLPQLLPVEPALFEHLCAIALPVCQPSLEGGSPDRYFSGDSTIGEDVEPCEIWPTGALLHRVLDLSKTSRQLFERVEAGYVKLVIGEGQAEHFANVPMFIHETGTLIDA